jgi:hypothetical protein
MVGQTLFPALMFIPGLGPVRTLMRVMSFGLALIAWAAVYTSGRRAVGRRFAAVPWMTFCAILYVLMVVHPSTDSLTAGLAAAALNLAILSPVFWAPTLGDSTRRVVRLLTLLLICNAASTMMGLLQYYRPGQFDPPTLRTNGLYKEDVLNSMMYTTADGRQVLRPCGLSDTPGGAATSGAFTCLIGLAWALRPIPLWKRLACAGMATAGMAIIYFCQVRSLLLMVLACQVLIAVLLAFQRDYTKLLKFAAVAAVMFTLALGWVVRSGGEQVIQRFRSLLEGSAGEVYYKNRGHFLETTFNYHLPQYPLGAGLGHWGMINVYFGNRTTAIYAEIQPTAWILDGGALLLVGYSGGIAAAILATIRLIRRRQDAELGYAGAVICAIGMSIVVTCLSSLPFISPSGVQFWAMFGALHGAANRAAYQRAVAARAAGRAPGGSARGPGLAVAGR